MIHHYDSALLWSNQWALFSISSIWVRDKCELDEHSTCFISIPWASYQYLEQVLWWLMGNVSFDLNMINDEHSYDEHSFRKL